MANTTFRGPLRTGLDTGVSTSETIGYVQSVKRVALGAGSTIRRVVFSLPKGSDIMSMNFYTTSAFNATGGVQMRVGTSSDASYYASAGGAITGVKALELSAANCINAGGSTTLIAEVSASVAGSAASFTAGGGFLFIGYAQRGSQGDLNS